jgi:formate/nitrite transporter FocA (FNT family)
LGRHIGAADHLIATSLGEIVESGLILGALLVCVALWMMVVPSGRKRVPGGA